MRGRNRPATSLKFVAAKMPFTGKMNGMAGTSSLERPLIASRGIGQAISGKDEVITGSGKRQTGAVSGIASSSRTSRPVRH